MKILSGTLRGRTITYTPHEELRPSADKVRKAVVDILQQVIEGQSVLDLYSGTGAFGLEVLSRGASSVCFVEKVAERADQIKKNIERFHLQKKSDVLNKDVFSSLVRMGRQKRSFDIVFLDPPYADNLCADTVKQIAENGVVKPGGFVAAECPKKIDLPEEVGSLKQIMLRRYGQTKVVIYQAASLSRIRG